jgi:predicted ATPase/class 3 adenylate cyclase
LAHLPSGTVTFLFTDIEGSAERWDRDRQAMAAAVARHVALLDMAIQAQGGVHFKTVGDAVQAAFPTAPQALAATLDGQRSLLAEDWGEIGQLKVRMALHAGEAIPDARGDYLSAPLNRLSRLLATGHGGQILLTQTVQQLCRGALPGDVELWDLGEHRLRDLLEPERVYQLVHPDVPADFPSLRSLDARPHNLPLQPTPLVGREADIVAIEALINQQSARLVTLTGPGGTGKTRLAQAVAANLLDTFSDGVWFVDLAPLNDPALVLPTIARTLGLREMGTASVQDALSAYLASKRLLVVLDNFEHLLEAAPVVSDLLGAGPGNAVLATSREPLRLRGEREVAVAPLAVPDRLHHLATAELAQNPAVILFVQRAQAARADFELTKENAATVAVICRRVDGLPLAIELAAARVKVLTPSALLTRLDNRLPLLAGGPRDAPARQRTLRDTIAWSHDLLSEEECVLFRHLGVFAGGWTFEAAEAVANIDGALDVFSGITSLVDKSLVRQSDQGEDEPRFTMLETIREFAVEHLRAHADEEAAMRHAHASFFTALALDQQIGLRSGVPNAVKRVRAEEDNFRTMLAHLFVEGDAETLLRVAGGSLSEYWLVAGGEIKEGRAWLDRALQLGANASPTAKAWGLYGLTILAVHQWDLVEARRAGTEGLALARASNDPLLASLSPFALALVEEAEGRLAAAESLIEESLLAAQALNDPGLIGWSRMIVGNVRWQLGDRMGGRAAAEEALTLFRGMGAVWGETDGLTMLARQALDEGALGRAAQLHAEALRLRRDAGEPIGVYNNLVGLAAIAHKLGHYEAAAQLLGAEETYRMVSGYQGFGSTPGLRDRTRQELATQLDATCFSRAWDAGRALSTEQAIAEALAIAETLSKAHP